MTPEGSSTGISTVPRITDETSDTYYLPEGPTGNLTAPAIGPEDASADTPVPTGPPVPYYVPPPAPVPEAPVPQTTPTPKPEVLSELPFVKTQGKDGQGFVRVDEGSTSKAKYAIEAGQVTRSNKAPGSEIVGAKQGDWIYNPFTGGMYRYGVDDDIVYINRRQ